EAAYGRALAIDPTAIEAHLRRGRVLLDLGRAPEAGPSWSGWVRTLRPTISATSPSSSAAWWRNERGTGRGPPYCFGRRSGSVPRAAARQGSRSPTPWTAAGIRRRRNPYWPR